MMPKKGQELELQVTGLAFGGRGVARVDGLTVFVDQTAPGDRVLARVVRRKKRYAEARLIRLLAPSAHRVQPPCVYSGTCGGCKWQFLDYPEQLRYKREHVLEALAHIGLLQGVTVHPTLPSPLSFGYRNKMEFTCADRRWLMPSEIGQPEIDPNFALGLHVPGTFHKVLDTAACLLQPDMGNRLLAEVRGYLRNASEPVYGLRTHEGFWRFVVLRHSVARDEWMVNIVTAAEKPSAVEPLARQLMAAYPRVVSVINNITARKAGVAVGEREILLGGAPVIRDRIDPFEYEISANSFFQTNTRGAGQLYALVKRYARLTGAETLIDLYCGTGTIAISLSDAARQVVGLEIAAGAVADAERNCRLNGVDNCRFVVWDIRQALAGVAETAEVMGIDPPRVGMHADVLQQVLARAPQRIVYVSCNPATLARDIGVLKDAYAVREIQPVDMFPHTFHIEAVARLEKI
jgi:23S rRNA (uracil1939-C5)-methyltransferase